MFRGVYDQMIKNMTVPNGVKKGYGITKVRLRPFLLKEVSPILPRLF